MDEQQHSRSVAKLETQPGAEHASTIDFQPGREQLITTRFFVTSELIHALPFERKPEHKPNPGLQVLTKLYGSVASDGSSWLPIREKPHAAADLCWQGHSDYAADAPELHAAVASA